MKRIISICVLILSILACMSVTAFAEDATGVKVTLDGEKIDCAAYGQEAAIVEGRTLVPLRAIFEALGASVEWNQDTRTVTSTLDDTTIKLTIGENTLYRNNEEVELDVPAQIMNSRTMVPARAIAESFGVNVEWDSYSRTVVLMTDEYVLSGSASAVYFNNIPKNIPQGASVVLEKYLNNLIDMNFTGMAPYCVDSYGIEELGISDINGLVDYLGFTKQSISDYLLAESFDGDKDYKGFADALAQVIWDYVFDAAETFYCTVDGAQMISDGQVDFEVSYYVPEFDVEELFSDALSTAIEKALFEGKISIGMSRDKMMNAIADILAVELGAKLDGTLDAETYNAYKTETVSTVKCNDGKWRVKVPEDDVEFVEILKNGGEGVDIFGIEV